jgi:hypothetical protein
MPFIKNHFTKHFISIAFGLFIVAILSVGTASAAYLASRSTSNDFAKPTLPKQVTLVSQDNKIMVTPAELGWSTSKVNQATLAKKVRAIADSNQQAPVDAKIAQQGDDYVISPSVAGQKIDVDKAVKMIRSGLFAGQATIKLPAVTLPPAVIEASLQPQLQQMKAQHAAAVAAAKAAQAAKAAKPAAARSCADNPAGRKLILVNLGQQHMWACNGTSSEYDTAITSGASLAGTGTPTGTWRVYSKSANINLTGPGYSYPVNYWMAFYSDYGFHDSSWQTFPYGSPEYASQGSHGCIHVPASAMGWLYGWAPTGTTVTITR